MDNDIIIDESLKKELPTDDPNAMYNRKRAVELAPVQKLTKHQQRQLRKKNLLEAPKSKASEKKEKKKEARRKTLEKYNRRDTVLEQISKVTISEESSSLITPTSSLGTKQSKRRRYEEALKRKQMGLSYDQNIIDSVEKKMSLSKIEAAREEGWNVSDDSSDAEDKITQPTEELKEPPQLFTPLIKIAEEKPKTSDETKNEEIQPEVHPEPRLAINVPLNRPEGVDEIRSKLPIIGEEQTIVEKIHENDVVILCGETGSGKTTQIPQFLYEAGYGTLRTHGKIVVTEPRKVAAINMSKRVAYETGLPWGQKVGYQVRNNKYYTDSTVIKFCTDGILLREAEEDLLLSKYSVVIIDEAHERTVNTDVLIGLLSRIVVLRRERVEKGESNIEKLKLIIMSATLRVDDFLKNKRLFEIEPPLINIDARQYDVQVHFSRNTPAIEKRLDTVKHCVEMIHERMPPGGILVFLPGKNEIKECVSYFSKLYSKERVSSNRPNKSNTKKHTEAENTEDKSTEQIEIEDVDEIMDLNQKIEIIDKKPMIVLPLYSLLSQEEQDKVFQEYPKDLRLVVFSTNIAETSITIPNIRYVVDLGLEKCREFDFRERLIKTNVDFISQASAEQRKGRAGRTGPGHCFRLYSSAFFQTFDKFTKPEIQRKPITEVVLLLKTMGLNDITKFPFPTLITPESLQEAETTLKHIGLIDLEPPFKANLLGKVTSQFPLEPRLGKFIVSAKKVNLVEYAIIVAAGLDVREPLNGKPDKKLISKVGDPFTLLNAFGAYLYEKSKNREKEFCIENHISQKAMEEMQQIRQQLTNIIWKTDKGCLKNDKAGLVEPNDSNAEIVLAQCLFSSYCDHVAKYDGKGKIYTTAENKKCEIRGNSCLFDKEPTYITYIDIDETNDKKRFNYVTKIYPLWINQIGSKLYLNRKKLGPPKYFPDKDAVLARVEATFGQPNWNLPAADIPHPEPYRTFASALLQGIVFPQLAQFKSKLISNPNDLENTNRSLPQRLMLIVMELKRVGISSKRDLEAKWVQEPLFLISQCMMWYPDKNVQSKLSQIWPLKSANQDKKIEFSDYESDSDTE